jgi:hypothetical protein
MTGHTIEIERLAGYRLARPSGGPTRMNDTATAPAVIGLLAVLHLDTV